MGLLEQLQDQGWHLLPAGLERLLEGTAGTTIEAKQAIKLALDTDLREIGGGALGSITTRGSKVDTIDGNIVVQILKIRNISAPKANEESKAAPRLLKLTLTDGQTQYSALEGEHVPSISLDTPPGTKIYLKNGPIKISQGLLILNANNVSVLGGKVPALVEKWELGRAMAKYAKGGRIQLSASGPPPWIAFGQKIQQNLPNDKNFKSLQTKEKDESKENAEFTALRNDAIAEATKLGTKKTFGGGAKQMVDANVQKIMDKGFSEDQATHALKLTRNNVHRALSNLQRIEERKQTQSDIKTGKIEPPLKLGKRGLGGKRDLESDSTSKPSAKVSLFDFLEDILPESDTSNKKSTSKESTPFSSKENKSSADSYSSKQMSNTAYLGASTNNRSSSSSNPLNQYQANSSPHYNNATKSYNQQRFENNISSSFANRNSHTSSNRNYNQQPQQPHQPGMNASSGYKPSTDYNSGRYNSHSNDAHPRARQDSKYGQSHSSYNPHQHQQQPQYRNDNYNNNNSSGGQLNKYNSNLSSNGKPQQTNAGYNYGHVDARSSQCYNGQGDSRKHPSAQPTHYQQQQQQQQSQQTQQQVPYHPGSKPVHGYNATNNASGHPNSLHSNATNHYAQQNANGMNNNGNYNSGNGAINVKVQKPRFGKEEQQKYPGPPISAAATQGRKPQPKVHNSSQPQAQGTSTAPVTGSQPPFVPGSKQLGTTPPGNNKMAQLAEATANLQLGSKSFNNNPQVLNTAKAPQGPTGPPPPSTGTAPVVPKSYIQLPNGFNYNPYQIMGFQNKQTNEFALNVLKSQQFDALQSAHLAAVPPSGPPVPTVSGPLQGVTLPPSATVVPSVLAAPAAGPTSATVHPTTVLPNWKVGDRCLAKYWEDGGFYNAEITGISENTFVVCFLEYGNYEEVLKTDCIPLSQPTGPATAPPHGPPPPAGMSFHPPAGTHLPPGAPLMPPPSGAYPGQGADSQSGQHFSHGYKPQTSQYPHHPPPHHQSQQQQQRPSKFREQRPMYVPPAQRK